MSVPVMFWGVHTHYGLDLFLTIHMLWHVLFGNISYRLGPAQDVTFFYTGYNLSELQSCALVFSTHSYFIFTFK